MAAVFPFRALRPTPERAAAVAAVPYDVVSTVEARDLAAGNPLSFLRVSRAEIQLPADTNPYSDAVYETALRNFEWLRREAPLVIEDDASLYFYRLRMGTHEQTGLAACYSMDEYERDVIKKHERTRKDKEDDRTRHMIELRAQTGPVFLTHQPSGTVDAVAARVTRGAPLFDFTAVDSVRHSLWRVPPEDVRPLVDAFAGIPFLYIADGHHRAASAQRARQQLREGTAAPARLEADGFLGVAFPSDQVQILPYHRVVKDLAGHTAGSFVDALHARVAVRPGGDAPAGPGHVSMYFDGQWSALTLAPASRGASPAEALDVARLHDQVLAPVLRIGDVRVDKRIDFVGGSRGSGALARLVDEGQAAVAFAMHPVGVGDLLAIADAGEIMPPKSTWFEPKLRDGLLSHII
ncbi:MAG TPA: DUF1015 family protein [Vicinamibacterales bacterium]|nr:DUF1015 family protein [Vicinamibacterales bacterium]